MNAAANPEKIPLLVLAGPTAVGKSQVALRLAELIDTDIISADSAQVYREMNIGTAKPSFKEQKLVKHHLLDLVNPNQEFSVADYQTAANEVIAALWSRGKLPLVVGGTGLYIRALTTAYSFGCKGPDLDIRKQFETQADLHGLNHLYLKLVNVDPAAAKSIHRNDRRRIIRALEVYCLEGKPISDQVKRTADAETPYQSVLIGLTTDRRILYERIDKRVEQMLEDGFLDEVRSLIKKGYSEHDPGLQILGYRQLCAYLQGKTGWPETVANIKKETRNLAKRQLTWFKKEKNIYWLTLDQQTLLKQLAENIYTIVKDLTTWRANITC